MQHTPPAFPAPGGALLPETLLHIEGLDSAVDLRIQARAFVRNVNALILHVFYGNHANNFTP
jgi:hypothetical protein